MRLVTHAFQHLHDHEPAQPQQHDGDNQRPPEARPTAQGQPHDTCLDPEAEEAQQWQAGRWTQEYRNQTPCDTDADEQTGTEY